MKTRTKLTYNVSKHEEFDHIKKRTITTYNRYAEITVTASTDVEALAVLDEIRYAIEKNTGHECQRCYCNDEVEYDSIKNVWVAWECVSLKEKAEYEEVKEAYKTWKEMYKYLQQKVVSKKDPELSTETIADPELPVVRVLETDDNFARLYDEKWIEIKISTSDSKLTQKYHDDLISYCKENNLSDCSNSGKGTRGREITYLEASVGFTTTDTDYLEQLERARKIINKWIELINNRERTI